MSERYQQPETGPPPHSPFQPDPHPQSQPQPEEGTRPVWTNYKRLLLFILGSAFFASVLGLVYYLPAWSAVNEQGTERDKLSPTPATPFPVSPCLSSACQRASARLALSVDPFTRPCDYFLFTCGADGPATATRGRQRGKGVSQHRNSQGKRGVRTDGRGRRGREERETDRELSLGEDQIPNRQTALLWYLREILESDRWSGWAAEKARGFYHSCMDTRSIQTAGAEPFLTLIQKLGGWAVSGQWNKTDFNSTLGLLMRDYFTFPFFNLYVGKDPNDADGSARRYIQIDQPDLLMPIEWNSGIQKSIVRTQHLRHFLESCDRYLALLGAPPSSLHVGVFMSVSSELAVAAAPLSHRQLKGLLHQRITIRQLQTQAPAIDWLGCLQTAFQPLPISQDDDVLLHNLPYILQMSHTVDKWLNKHELSSSGPLHTYMVLNLLHTFIPALDSRFTEIKRNLSVDLGNAEGVVPRWEQCVRETETGFDTILTHLIQNRTSSAHGVAEEIIQNIFSSFKSKLADLKWKDDESRRFVMNKVHSLIPRLLTDAEIRSEDELSLLFYKVTIYARDYFSNYIQLLSLRRNKRNKLFSPAGDADVLSVTPFLSGNELIFPMGMFIPPLFHHTYPRAVNYGVLGSLMAKDILRLLLPDILSQSESVQAVGECVWRQYISATEGPGRVGAFSLSAAQQQEMWVQYTALQVALQAYQQSLEMDPSDTSLSDVSYTHLFLMSFSQVNCDSDPYREFMPFEPSFMITVICANSELCPTSLACPNRTRHHLLQTC